MDRNIYRVNVECVNKTDANEKTSLEEKGHESFVAHAHLRNSDSDKYGSLKKNFQTQYALNNDQYPKTATAVSDVLSSHQWDPTYKESQKRKKEQ